MTTVDWTLDSLADTTFDVQFFDSVGCHASGHGEGQTLLHTARVTTDADGHVPGVLITDHFGGLSLTMTATAVSHFIIDIPVGLPARGFEVLPESTSEFSPCAQLPIVIEPPQL